ncbi:MAG: peptidyl-prolyl cis-trans isomerase [Verrucomicrobiae bacterium]|nr:peptidyl-prolyl cis-trans isomerase [Verrucomicrobiae bacterium]
MANGIPFGRSTARLTGLLVLGAAVCCGPVAMESGAAVLARGRGVEVTQEQLDEAFINLRATLAAQGRGIAEGQRRTIERQLVEKLALTQLLLLRATDEDRRVAGEKVARLIDEQRARAKSQARFEAQVRAAGLDPESFERQLHERAICEEVLGRELKPLLGVTPERVRRVYDERSEEFRRPERVRVRQVVIALRDPAGGELSATELAEKETLARRLADRARRGEDIGALARDFSDDPAGRERQGEYVFPLGRMVPELEAALRKLEPGRVSDLIRTEFGLHVVKLEERLPGEKVPFEEVREALESRMELEATQEALPKYQETVFREAGIEWVGFP